MNHEKILVVSAHALDYLWRCGGTIAKYTKSGSSVTIIDLTCGERGESNEIWKKNPDMTPEEVAQLRRTEASAAAELLGAEIRFKNWPDHMLQVTPERTLELARDMMELQPTILLTHFTQDPMNPDHPAAVGMVIEAMRCAQTYGVFPGVPPCGPIKMFMLEPAYPETVGYVPDVYIDITDTWQLKLQAMSAGGAQQSLAESYDKRNGYRGHLAAKLSGNKGIRYAETFQRFKPYVGDWFC